MPGLLAAFVAGVCALQWQAELPGLGYLMLVGLTGVRCHRIRAAHRAARAVIAVAARLRRRDAGRILAMPGCGRSFAWPTHCRSRTKAATSQ